MLSAISPALKMQNWWKEGEEICQRTGIDDPGTCTMVWELTVGAGGELGRERQRGKNWDNCNRIHKNNTIKNENSSPASQPFNYYKDSHFSEISNKGTRKVIPSL